tara:strand:+ start:2200 stop:3006 length:807 start_codon:yes stop_codon:yes gene_type:complete
MDQHPQPQAPGEQTVPMGSQAQQPGMAMTGPMSHSAPSVQHEITHGPSFAMLRVDVMPGQTVVAEAGSMVARQSHVNMDVKMNAGGKGGFFAVVKAFFIALIRKVAGGETFFVNHFTAPQQGSVWVAPTLSGTIAHRSMKGETITLSTGAYVASCGDFEMKLKFGGLKSLLAKEGAFFLQITGHGDLFFNSYGGVHPVDVNGSFMVDNGHLVGFEGNLEMKIQSAGGGMMGFMASGEGLVVVFEGQGRVYLQSRNVSSLVGWLTPLLP